MNTRTPAEVFSPGEFIRDELDARGWTQDDLAEIMGKPQTSINLIINDKRGITPETAIALGSAFGTSAEFWLNLDSAYKLSKVTPVPVEEIKQRAALFSDSPVKEMQKRGWIKQTDSIGDLKQELGLFYSDVDLTEFKMAARASTDQQGQLTPAQVAWCVRCLNLAKTIPTREYRPESMSACKKALRALADFPQSAAKVPEVFASFGLRFVVVEHLDGTKIEGAALWLGKGWEKPVIAVSVRYDRIDSFWHTVCHEVSHIEHRDCAATIDIDLLGNDKRDEEFSEIENRANREAADMLIPESKLQSFILRKRPYFSKISIIQFANANKIHPGIVAGQLHHKLQNWSANREMLVKIRDMVTSRAVTDGWGTQFSK